MLKTTIAILITFVTVKLHAQQLAGKVLNFEDKQPLEHVAVVTNTGKGTVTNANGLFTINTKGVNSLKFTRLGYQSITIPLVNFKNNGYTVYLQTKQQQLQEITLDFSKPNIDSILAKTSHFMQNNYLKNSTIDAYTHTTNTIDLKSFNIKLKAHNQLNKPSKKVLQQQLTDFSNQLKNTNTSYTNEFKLVANQHIIPKKKQINTVPLINIDTVLGYTASKPEKKILIHFKNLLLKVFDSTKIYKTKTSVFTIEDSLTVKKITNATDSINKKTFNSSTVKDVFYTVTKRSMFTDGNKLDNFLSTTYYKHRFGNAITHNNTNYYVIHFTPKKRKAKYAGTLYINTTNYALKKVTYGFADNKRGSHLNLKFLLGVKYSENTDNCTLIFEQTKDGKIYTSYFKQQLENYAYINRNLKFTSINTDKETIKFNIKMDLNVNFYTEVFLKATKNESEIKRTKPFNKRYKYLSADYYNTTSWKNKALINSYLGNQF